MEPAQFVVATVAMEGRSDRAWTLGEWVALLNVRVRRNMREATLVVSAPSPTLPLPPPPPLEVIAASLAGAAVTRQAKRMGMDLQLLLYPRQSASADARRKTHALAATGL